MIPRRLTFNVRTHAHAKQRAGGRIISSLFSMRHATCLFRAQIEQRASFLLDIHGLTTTLQLELQVVKKK